MDAWHIVLDGPAIRTMRALPPKVQWAVTEFLEILVENPYRVSKPLRVPLDGFRSARRGAYRVVLEIDEDERVVHVVRVDHRADVYRP